MLLVIAVTACSFVWRAHTPVVACVQPIVANSDEWKAAAARLDSKLKDFKKFFDKDAAPPDYHGMGD